MEQKEKVWIADKNPSIMRINEKCINCGQCQKTCTMKTGIQYQKEDYKEPFCVNCGQCILTCPLGALTPKYDYKKVLNYINDTDYIVTASIAPAVRVSLGESFSKKAGYICEGKVVDALKKLGFNYVFDVSFAADATIMEETTELINRINNQDSLPMFTSCCSSWVKYIEIKHPELIKNLSKTKSPISIQGELINNYFINKRGISKDKIINVVIAPCTSKKYEITKDHNNNIDFVLTTTELALMIKESNINFKTLKNATYNSLLKESSEGGLIFGTSGGVMEAAVRNLYKINTNKKPSKMLLKFKELRTNNEIKTATVDIGNKKIKIAAVYGLTNLEKLLPDYKNYDYIEVMTCTNGCVGGGGQPLPPINKIDNTIIKRRESLYKLAKKRKIKSSYQNTELKGVYNTRYLKPNSDLAKQELSTDYESINIKK